MKLRHRLLLSVCLTAAVSESAFAQLEEIVVTARKREESLLEVPLAISAVTAEAIEKYNFSDFDDLQYVTPGLVFTEAGNGIRNDRASFAYVIRGMNVGASGGGSAASTLFIDGAPSLFGRLSTFSNAERVEVLKGPQTAYFGRNTFSGAINIVTKTPGNEWSARLSGELAGYGSSDIDLSVEGPVMEDRLSFRAAARQLTKGGQYTDRSKGGDIGGRKTTSGSLTLYATPSDALRIKLFGEYARFDDELGPIFLYGRRYFNCSATGRGANNWICGEIPDTSVARENMGAPAVFDQIFLDRARPFSLFEDRLVDHGGLGSRQATVHGILDYDFANDWTFNSIAAWHRQETQILYEASHVATAVPAPGPFFPCVPAGSCERAFGQHAFQLESKAKDFSIEGRVSTAQQARLRGTVGVNYITGTEIPGVTLGELTSTRIRSFGAGTYATARTFSVFGGVYYDVFDRLTVSAEFRHQRDKVGRIPVDLAIGPGKPSTNPALTLEGTFKANAPRVTVEYELTDTAMLFGSWARGFRPGTFNPNILTLHPTVVAELTAAGAQVDVDEEKLDQFELGVKGSALDGRVQGSIVGYAGALKGQQITQGFFFNRPDINFISSVNVITNTGRTNIKGIEIEGSAMVTDAITVDGSFAWNHTKVVRDSCATCVRLGGTLNDSVGKKLQNVPEFTGHFTGTYTIPVTDDLDGYARAEYFYQSKRYATRQNLAHTGDMHKVNVRLGVRNETYSIEAFLLNAFDNDTVDGISLENEFPAGTPAVKVGLPERRQWGLRATYNF